MHNRFQKAPSQAETAPQAAHGPMPTEGKEEKRPASESDRVRVTVFFREQKLKKDMLFHREQKKRDMEDWITKDHLQKHEPCELVRLKAPREGFACAKDVEGERLEVRIL